MITCPVRDYELATPHTTQRVLFKYIYISLAQKALRGRELHAPWQEHGHKSWLREWVWLAGVSCARHSTNTRHSCLVWGGGGVNIVITQQKFLHFCESLKPAWNVKEQLVQPSVPSSNLNEDKSWITCQPGTGKLYICCVLLTKEWPGC